MSKNTTSKITDDDLDGELEEIFPPRPDRLFLSHQREQLAAVMPADELAMLQFEATISSADITKYFGADPQWVLQHLLQRLFTPPVRLGTEAHFRIDEVAELFSYRDLNPGDESGLRTLVTTLVATRPVPPETKELYRNRKGEILSASAQASEARAATSLFSRLN